MLTGADYRASLQDGRRVIGVPDEEWGERGHAFVSLTGQHCATAAQLQEFLAGRLASFKRPQTIEILAELPKNSVGKIAKAQLREPFWPDAGRLV